MKQIEETKTIIEKVTMWESEDGRKFLDKEQCSKWEESSIYALEKLLMGNTLHHLPTGMNEKKPSSLYFGPDTLFSCGDYALYIFKPETEEDIKHLLMWGKLKGVDFVDKWHRVYNEENYKETAERYHWTDKPEEWDNYRSFALASELKPGKSYIVNMQDDWGSIYEVERYKKTVENIVDSWVKFTENK